jgi:glycosyltransferase involved in cell wall biosynthesis
MSARRVALVLASSTGGIGRHVASLAEGLVALGDDVTVFGPAATGEHFDFAGTGAEFVAVEMPTGERAARPAAAAAPVYPATSTKLGDREAGNPATPMTSRSEEVGMPAAVRALRRALREWRPEVVHAHGLRAGLVAAAARRGPLLLGARAAVPLVVTWHNAVLAGGLHGRVLGFAERRVARAADVTLGASNDLVARARRLGARHATLGEIAAPPLPPPLRDPAAVCAEFGAAPGQPVVLSVGRLHPQKGYPVLIEAAARWRTRTPPPVVIIAGSGPEYLALAAQASATRAPVTLTGHRSDVADLLAAADVAVVSSVWEARQLFAQEALRAGVPLVATAVGGLPDLVGDAAVLVPAGSVDALDAAVTGLLDNPARCRDLASRGVARSRQWPTEEQTVLRVREVYAGLGARRAPVAGV